jgi:hypothetical protein
VCVQPPFEGHVVAQRVLGDQRAAALDGRERKKNKKKKRAIGEN